MKTRINDDLKAAMKAKDTVALSTIRLLKSAIHNEEIAKSRELNYTELVGIVRREMKARQDVIDIVGINDLVASKTASVEKGILEGYLPPQLTDEELNKALQGFIAEIEIDEEKVTKKHMGQLMKSMNLFADGRADGKRISTLVQSALK